MISTRADLRVPKVILLIVFVLLLVLPQFLKRIEEKAASIDLNFTFEEVSEILGVSFSHMSPILDAKIEHILPQIASVGASVSVMDFNKDGFSDLYFTSSRYGSTNRLYQNDSSGNLLDVSSQFSISDINHQGTGVSMGSIWADIDNDGFEDLFVYKWGKPQLFRNQVGKSFVDITEGSGLPDWVNSNSAIWLDFNRDGLVDLFLGGYYNEELNLWNLETTRILPESFEYANNGGRNYLLQNIGKGRFRDVTSQYGLSSTKWTLAAGSADLNGDGFMDLVIANDYSVDELYLNVGGKRFIEVSRDIGIGFTPKSGMNVSFADISNQGDLGLYITNISENGVLLQGNNYWSAIGSDGYQNKALEMNIENGGWSYGAQFGDFNNDGHQDLYVANGFISADPESSYWYEYSKVSGGNKAIISDASNWPPMLGKSQSGFQRNKCWINKGGEVLYEVGAQLGDTVRRDSRAVALVDLENKGQLNIVVANQNQRPFIFRPRFSGSNTNKWIVLSLEGRQSNRSAIGAIVELSTSAGTQKQIVTGGIGFSSQNQRSLHFGLGEDPGDIEFKIIWPSGIEERIMNPEKNRIHFVSEGANG